MPELLDETQYALSTELPDCDKGMLERNVRRGT